jgi:WD40 repeat protein
MDGSLRLWDGDSGAPIATLGAPWKLSRTKKDIAFARENIQHKGMVYGVTIVNDERFLSWAGQLPGYHPEYAQLDHSLQMWDANSGDHIATLKGHTEQVNGVAVNDGTDILSWSDDGTLRLWDGNTGATIKVIPMANCFLPGSENASGHSEKVSGAKILEDGSVLCWSRDRIFCVWSEQTGWSEYSVADVLSVGGNDPIFSMNEKSFREREFGAPALFFGGNLRVDGVSQGGTPTNAFEKRDPSPLSHMPRISFDSNLTVYWNGDGTWHAPALLQSGTLVVHCDKNLVFLHLYHGNRRVTLEDACEAASSSR